MLDDHERLRLLTDVQAHVASRQGRSGAGLKGQVSSEILTCSSHDVRNLFGCCTLSLVEMQVSRAPVIHTLLHIKFAVFRPQQDIEVRQPVSPAWDPLLGIESPVYHGFDNRFRRETQVPKYKKDFPISEPCLGHEDGQRSGQCEPFQPPAPGTIPPISRDVSTCLSRIISPGARLELFISPKPPTRFILHEIFRDRRAAPDSSSCHHKREKHGHEPCWAPTGVGRKHASE